jgi:hypothetical protein
MPTPFVNVVFTTFCSCYIERSKLFYSLSRGKLMSSAMVIAGSVGTHIIFYLFILILLHNLLLYVRLRIVTTNYNPNICCKHVFYLSTPNPLFFLFFLFRNGLPLLGGSCTALPTPKHTIQTALQIAFYPLHGNCYSHVLVIR